METCYFCYDNADRQDVIDAGWLPSFWQGEREVFCPVCPRCVRAALVKTPDGYENLQRPKLFVVRGLPGSGKSHLARQIHNDIRRLGLPVVVCSADDAMMQDGKYVFRPELLRVAHFLCQHKAANAMERQEWVIVDNTHCQKWEYEIVTHLARQGGYTVEIVEPQTSWAKNPEECAVRNTHGVPLETIQKMLARWED